MVRTYVNPQFRLILQDTELEGGMYVNYRSSKREHCDICKVSFDDAALGIIYGKNVEDCRVDMGIDDDYENIIDGIGTWETENDELIIRDEMKKLLDTTIKAAFVESTPQEAIRYVLALCGIYSFCLDDTVYSTKKTFVIDSLNGCDAIREINTAWGIDVGFYMWDGVFYWGKDREQEEIYEITDDNILDISCSKGIWEIDVIGIPWLHHSQYINVNCEELIAVGFVESVVIKSANDGSIDMSLRFQEVEDD